MGLIPTINNALGKPVVEQTQDFFIVFESITSTTPEVIDNSSYKILYLVDNQGNISKPSENADSARNVIQNFETNNKVTVIIDQDTSENNALAGEHSITAIGKPIPYLYSQNGISSGSFEKRLVFRDPAAPPSGAYDPVDAYAGANMVDNATTYFPTSGNSNSRFLVKDYNPTGEFVEFYLQGYSVSSSADLSVATMSGSSGVYTISSLDTNIQSLTFGVQLNLGAKFESAVEFFIQTGDWDGTTWTDNGSDYPVTLTTAPVGSTSTQAFLEQQGTFPPAVSTIIGQVTLTKADIGDKRNFRFFAKFPSDTIVFPIQTFGGSSGALLFAVQSQVPLPDNFYVDIEGGDKNADAYWEVSGKTLKASSRLTNFWNDIYVETSTQKTFGFDEVILPFSPRPGDKIRFQYNEDQVFTIYSVTPPGSSTTGQLELTLNKAPLSGVLQNFVLYRIDDSLANQLVLDVKKVVGIDDPNNPFTGIITPQYPSQNILDNSQQILEKLKSEGIIKN